MSAPSSPAASMPSASAHGLVAILPHRWLDRWRVSDATASWLLPLSSASPLHSYNLHKHLYLDHLRFQLYSAVSGTSAALFHEVVVDWWCAYGGEVVV
jgi:hypothetical protein